MASDGGADDAPSAAEGLIAALRAGDRVALGRAITLIESRRPDHRRHAQALLARLLPHAGGAWRVGITGVPGAGKSTLIEALGLRLADAGRRVAVLAVDPSSGVTGGSILGDKTRMPRLAVHPNAFIRPSPSGGALGGVARATREAMLVCEAAGFDVVVVETVGVGQSETLVAGMVDFVAVLVLAGAGDELQGIKRGILELADLVAVNKADGDNAGRAAAARADYARALHLLGPKPSGWAAPVVTCSGLEGTGLDAVWDAVVRHHAALTASGALAGLRAEQQRDWLWALLDEGLHARLRAHAGVAAVLAEAEAAVTSGRETPPAAAARVLAAFEGPEGAGAMAGVSGHGPEGIR